MGLKQSIVVRSQFTYKLPDGSGTRGSTPGDYVKRYMARGDAVENIAPTRVLDADKLLQRFEERARASDSSEYLPELKRKIKQSQKMGGVAFADGDPAISDEKLNDMSRFIQNEFDAGKTVFKTVLSFDEDWLRGHGILDPDFVLKRKGDFRGHVDQLKMRLAVMNGLKKMGYGFDDLHYVGCIQVDTKHLHVHLCMVDHGRGRLRSDGLQAGKLSETDKRKLRCGIDEYLDEKHLVRAMSSSVMHDRQNAVCYVKKFAHETLAKQGLPQFLIACLPENKNHWRASTNRKDMRKANTILREYVNEVLQTPGSGYDRVLLQIQQYAAYRKTHEDLEDEEYEKLMKDGQERVIQDCMNSVYGVLRQYPKESFSVSTPMLFAMSADYEQLSAMASKNPMLEFGFKLRTYSTRLRYHREQYHKFRDEYRDYLAVSDKSPDAKPLGDFLQFESVYQSMLMTKYQYFLTFLPPDKSLQQEFERLMDQKHRLENLKKMQNDPAFQRMSAKSAYEYGLKVYGQRGGDKIRINPAGFDLRVQAFGDRVLLQEREFRDKLHDYGLTFDGNGITKKKRYAFSKVKALDLHHLGYDFQQDAPVADENIRRFQNMALQRHRLYESAKDYLERSGQGHLVSYLPGDDVQAMKSYADSLKRTTVLKSGRAKSGHARMAKTVPLGTNYVTQLEQVVSSTIRGTTEYAGFS